MAFERLSEKQDIILYRISILQDEQGRQSSLKLKKDIDADSMYTELLDKEYLTYEQYGDGDDAVCSLIITLKGQRYCYQYLDEIAKLDKESRQQW